ncbi:pentapeptide repeat-containing protein [Flavobacterium pallidum]|uniref:MCBG-like protein n=1 Tax=Flavobacterium pallidum TaxID=2172098 RepID=A0A2S1SJR6_9FLAO|nr:pentapeptide repeat-containing protein [Flavobacterium pallidum]AWI26587.1 MCBG-like protein [Flavobacterium pallidum]
MENLINIDVVFEKLSLFNQTLRNREFDGCIFRNCDFSGSDLSNNTFTDCEFHNCNLGMAKLRETGLKTVSFTSCKLIGVRFDETEEFLFSVSFDNSILDYACFENKKMPKTTFSYCSLRETIFIGANLTDSDFDHCNLEGAIFNETELKECDFTTAYNFAIDPEFNPMKKAKFSTEALPSLLTKYDIKII